MQNQTKTTMRDYSLDLSAELCCVYGVGRPVRLVILTDMSLPFLIQPSIDTITPFKENHDLHMQLPNGTTVRLNPRLIHIGPAS